MTKLKLKKMLKQGNRNSDLLQIIRDLKEATCAQVAAEYEVALKKKVDSAAISTALFRMVQEGILRYSTKTGPKGGHVYILGDKAQTRRLVLKLKINGTGNNP